MDPRVHHCAFIGLALAAVAAVAAPQAAPTDEVAKLRVSLKDPEAPKRAAAARILGELGAPAKEAVPDLADALKDEAREVRQNAAQALGDLGPVSRPAVSPLIGLLGDREWQVRRAAAYALGRIGSPEAETPLKNARKDSNESVRDAAKAALKQIKKAKG
jgi:HEAT repeat protein